MEPMEDQDRKALKVQKALRGRKAHKANMVALKGRKVRKEPMEFKVQKALKVQKAHRGRKVRRAMMADKVHRGRKAIKGRLEQHPGMALLTSRQPRFNLRAQMKPQR